MENENTLCASCCSVFITNAWHNFYNILVVTTSRFFFPTKGIQKNSDSVAVFHPCNKR